VTVKGFYEVDGTRHELTRIPFRFDAKVHRIVYQIEPTGGGPSVCVEIYEGGRSVEACCSRSPGYRVRGWRRFDIIGPGAASHESFDPGNDPGWQRPPE
jgi:hypothetical protein